MNIEEKKRFLINTFYLSTVAILIFLAVKFLLAYLLPFIIGIGIAFSVRKITQKFTVKNKRSQVVCSALLTASLYILAIAVVFLLIWALVSFAGKVMPKYFSEITNIYSSIKNTAEKLLGGFSDDSKNIIINLFEEFFHNGLSKIGNSISVRASKIIKNMPRIFISGIVTVTASFYIAKDYDKLLRFFKNLVKPTIYQNIVVIKDIFIKSILKIFSGYLILALVTFIELLIGFLLFGFKNAFSLALLIALVDILPVLGSGLVMIPWAIVSFINLQFKTGVVVLVIFVLTIISRNILEPKIISQKIGVNPLLTLLAIFLGYKISGFVGMIMLPVVLIIIINYYKLQMKAQQDN